MSEAPKPQLPTILAVDDSPTVLRVIEFVLSGAGYRVVGIDRGKDVAPKAKELQPNLILLDFAMPDLNGYEVCARLGEHRDLEHVPIVMMSTKGDMVGETFIREMGIVDHITKPFSPDALLAVVQHTLQKAAHTQSFRRRDTRDDRMGDRTREREGLLDAITKAACQTNGSDLEPVRKALEKILDTPELRQSVRALFTMASDGVALSGALEVVPLAEVLQLLSLQRQSGWLRVRRGHKLVSMAFQDGDVRLVTAENLGDEFLLGSILVREKLIDADDLHMLLNNRRGTKKRLGTQVVQLGYVTREALHEALRSQSSEIVYEILRFGSGTFEFQPKHELPEEVLEFEFDLTIDELLMEGFRRVDEWGLIESTLPSFDAVPTVIPGGEQHAGPDGLTKEEQQALVLVDGSRTIRKIIETMGAGTFAGASLVYRLAAARVIDVPSTNR